VQQVAIVTDASVDLPEAAAAEAGLGVAPLNYDVGGRHYVSGEQPLADFYAALAAGGKALVEGVSADDFEDALRVASKRATDVICACQSVGSSFTRVSAEVAVRRLQNDGVNVQLISPGRSTAGLGALCLAAAKLAAGGAGTADVFRFLEESSLSSDTYAIPGSLDHLERTGELTILSSQSSVGRIDGGIPLFRVRGRVSAAAATADHATAEHELLSRVERAADGRPLTVVVSHADGPAAAQRLADAAKARLGASEVHISALGPTIGAVLGPGSVALGFCAAAC
jgi:DegV family protein with EDD domain